MKKQSKVKVLLRMLGLVRPLAGFMVLAVIFGTLGFLTAQFIPILGGMAVLSGLGVGAYPAFTTLVWLLLIFALLRAVCRLAEQRTNHYIAFTLLAIIRDRVFRALRRLCPAKLEGRDKGDLIALITADVELLEVFYAHTISPICIAVTTETFMCIFIGSYHPLLGLTALCAFALVGIALPLIIAKRSGNMGDELRSQAGGPSAHMLESIRGIDDTMQYGYGDKRLGEITEKTKALSDKQRELNRLTGTNAAIANMLILLSDIGMLALCTRLYQTGQIGFDGFLIPLIALMSSFGPVTALAALGTTLQSTVASGARVLAVIDEEPETEDITGREETGFAGAEVQNVSFSYAEENVLRNVSLTIPQKRIMGIVGKSGCGSQDHRLSRWPAPPL